MEFNKEDTAVVITDPQNDFLSEKGVTWGPVSYTHLRAHET